MEKVKEIVIEDTGITVNYEQMKNGESRYRLYKNDGSGYIRTEAGSNSKWQDSHYHSSAIETYIVQKGWIAIATLIGGILDIEILHENAIYTIHPKVIHNCYMSSGAHIHTVKHGSNIVIDKYESKELDKLTKYLVEEDILNFRSNKEKLIQ